MMSFYRNLVLSSLARDLEIFRLEMRAELESAFQGEDKERRVKLDNEEKTQELIDNLAFAVKEIMADNPHLTAAAAKVVEEVWQFCLKQPRLFYSVIKERRNQCQR